MKMNTAALSVSTPVSQNMQGPILATLLAWQSQLPKATLTIAPGASSIKGGSGSDVIDGGWGVSTMIGGAGDDVFIVRNQKDVVVESHIGKHDTIITYSGYALPANITNLVMVGSGSGWLVANNLDDTIVGNAGADTFFAGAGHDTFVAGTGKDTFVINKGNGSDLISGFKTASDVVELHGFQLGNFAALKSAMTQS